MPICTYSVFFLQPSNKLFLILSHPHILKNQFYYRNDFFYLQNLCRNIFSDTVSQYRYIKTLRRSYRHPQTKQSHRRRVYHHRVVPVRWKIEKSVTAAAMVKHNPHPTLIIRLGENHVVRPSRGMERAAKPQEK